MHADTIGMISGGIVIVSIIPYAMRTQQGKVQPNLTSWFLWTIIGFALLLTYRSSGAEANVWPAIFGFTNPFLITILVLKKRGQWALPNRFEIVCLIFGLLSLGLWFFVREQRELAQYALYLAIVADLFAAIPTIVFVWKSPSEDRPGAWFLFAVGYSVALFAIPEHTIANWALPVYMVVGAVSVTLPLTLYRIRCKIPIGEWL